MMKQFDSGYMMRSTTPAKNTGSHDWTADFHEPEDRVWFPPEPRADPGTQRALSEVLSRPKKMNARARSAVLAPQQTSFGLAAHRHLCARATKWKAHEERRRLERLERLRAAAAAAGVGPGLGDEPADEPAQRRQPALGTPPSADRAAAGQGQPERGLLLGAFEHRSAERSLDDGLGRRDGAAEQPEAALLAGPVGVHRGLVGWQLARVSEGGGGPLGAQARLE